MPAQPETQNQKRLLRVNRLDAQIMVTVVAVALAALALLIAARNEHRVKLEVGDEVSVQDAESILNRANEVAGFADSLLSFLEGASVVVGAGLAVGAWMLRNSIQKQIDTNNSFVEETRREFARREKNLTQLETELAERLDAMVKQSKKDIEEVEGEARDSFRVLSLLVLAEQQVRAHNIDTAIRTLQSAYEMAPNNHATNYLLGYLYSSRKQFDLAIERLEHALALEPDFTPAIAALGLALRRKGDSLGAPEQRTERAELWAQAESKLLEALRKDKRLTDADGESYFGTLGGLYRRQGRYDDALYAYEQAQQITPDSSYPIINLATLYKHQGNDEKAAHYYRKVLRAAGLMLDDDPRNAWARADYAQAKLVLGHPDEAMQELQTLIEGKPEHGLLETVRSGLQFLGESPGKIEGFNKMVALLDEALYTPGGDEL